MKMKDRYKLNKNAKVGVECVCPSCCTSFMKTTYQQAFCASKPKTKCKDKYWNTVTPSKKNNTTRISPANFAYYNDFIRPVVETNDNYDGSWDAHNCHVEGCSICEKLDCECDF